MTNQKPELPMKNEALDLLRTRMLEAEQAADDAQTITQYQDLTRRYYYLRMSLFTLCASISPRIAAKPQDFDRVHAVLNN